VLRAPVGQLPRSSAAAAATRVWGGGADGRGSPGPGARRRRRASTCRPASAGSRLRAAGGVRVGRKSGLGARAGWGGLMKCGRLWHDRMRPRSWRRSKQWSDRLARTPLPSGPPPAVPSRVHARPACEWAAAARGRAAPPAARRPAAPPLPPPPAAGRRRAAVEPGPSRRPRPRPPPSAAPPANPSQRCGARGSLCRGPGPGPLRR
jgi:hypothetical protein